MRHIHGLVSTAQALRQIFVGPIISPRIPLSRTPTSALPYAQLRPFQSSRIQRKIGGKFALNPTVPKVVKDEEIRAEYVRVASDEGGLSDPEPLADILETLDRSKFYVVQVSPGEPRKPPVCKIVEKTAFQDQERAKARAAHVLKASTKQIELNWAIDPHDLSHRLKQLTTFLDKGRKVEIVLTTKKRKRLPTADEVKGVMDRIMDTLRESNAVQVKPMEGQPGKHVTIVAKKRDAL